MSNYLKIEVLSTDIEVRQGVRVNEKTGREEQWKIVTQKVYFHVGGAYPEGFDISLDHERGQGAWPAGTYLLSGKSVRRGKYGPELTRYLDLVPFNQPKAN